jgi:hypothetical protein
MLSRISQINAQFNDSLANNNVTDSSSGGASVNQSNGRAIWASGTANTSSALVISNQTLIYKPGREIYFQFTWAVLQTITSVNSYARIGLYDANNGFFVNISSSGFSVGYRNGGVDTLVAQSSFNVTINWPRHLNLLVIHL